jgi:sugar phosphate isomerase/epimerase
VSTLTGVQTNSDGKLIKVPAARIGLSTSSVYPETTSSAFELARRLGYDGVELMIGIDPVAADIDAVEKLRDYHGVPVLSVHSPCLLITQRVWGTDNWVKLERSAEAARRLNADVVVVHPPFRWQREYARGFVAGVRRLSEETGILFSVENMYPWRTPGGELKAYMPGWDPTELDYDDLTLDFSHASTSNQQSLDLARNWGSRLRHVHLTDGTGSIKDEHLVPGRGDQQAGRVLQYLAEQDFSGHIVLEVNLRRSATRAQREADLAESLAFARLYLAAPVHTSYAVDRAGVASAL